MTDPWRVIVLITRRHPPPPSSFSSFPIPLFVCSPVCGNDTGVWANWAAQGCPAISKASELTRIHKCLLYMWFLGVWHTECSPFSHPPPPPFLCHSLFLTVYFISPHYVFLPPLCLLFRLAHDAVSHFLWPGEAIRDSTKRITQPLSTLLRLYIKIQQIYAAVSTRAATWGLWLLSPLTDRNMEVEAVRQREGEADCVATVPDFLPLPPLWAMR